MESQEVGWKRAREVRTEGEAGSEKVTMGSSDMDGLELRNPPGAHTCAESRESFGQVDMVLDTNL